MTEQGKDTKQPPTQLKRLSLKAFRNYTDADLELGPGLNLVIGPNGHGKTNLVEAVYFLCLGRSFRERIDRRLIMFGAPQARLCGDVEWAGRGHKVEVAWRRSGSKKAWLDGAKLGRISELVGKTPVVSLTPEDGSLVHGDPGARRRFLDIVLAQTDRSYLSALKRYRRALLQRNLCLREGRFTLAEAYEDSLEESAVEIRRCRRALVDFIQESSAQTYRDISSQGESLRLKYRPNPPTGEEDTDSVAQALSDARDLDRERGFTSVGPHRDDIQIDMDERELKTYGSHGQSRTALATLKLAEVSYYLRIYNRPPILIMDEVAAVLDRGRASNLIRLLSDMSSQVFVTSPSVEDLGSVADAAGCVVEVEEGKVSRKR